MFKCELCKGAIAKKTDLYRYTFYDHDGNIEEVIHGHLPCIIDKSEQNEMPKRKLFD